MLIFSIASYLEVQLLKNGSIADSLVLAQSGSIAQVSFDFDYAMGDDYSVRLLRRLTHTPLALKDTLGDKLYDAYISSMLTPFSIDEVRLMERKTLYQVSTKCGNDKTFYRYGFNSQEKDNELKGKGNILNYEARINDTRLGRWMSIDPLAKSYPFVSPYVFVLNTPIQAKDPDGKRVYFVGGAGNDQSGWNYIDRFNKSWTNLGIQGFTRIDATHGKAGDVLFTNTWRNNLVNGEYSRSGITHYAQNDEQVKKAVNDIVNDITSKPLAEGEQLNLAGYSYGSVVQANAAIALINKGYKVDNLILIGSPTEEGSQLMESLRGFEKAGKIGKIIRQDIKGDHLSNPSGELEFMYGGFQNRDPSGYGDGPHFDLARPDNPATKGVDEGKQADKKIEQCGQDIQKAGVK